MTTPARATPCRYLSPPIPGYLPWCRNDEAPWYWSNISDTAKACGECRYYEPSPQPAAGPAGRE